MPLFGVWPIGRAGVRVGTGGAKGDWAAGRALRSTRGRARLWGLVAPWTEWRQEDRRLGRETWREQGSKVNGQAGGMTDGQKRWTHCGGETK